MARNIFDGGAAVAADKTSVDLESPCSGKRPQRLLQACRGFEDQPRRVVSHGPTLPPLKLLFSGQLLPDLASSHFLSQTTAPQKQGLYCRGGFAISSIERLWLDGIGGGGTSHAVTLGA
jgi:hypothetical protein